jgi:hypothetical protein
MKLETLPVSDANTAARMLLTEQPKEFVLFMLADDHAKVWYSTISNLTTIVGAMERAKFCIQHDEE